MNQTMHARPVPSRWHQTCVGAICSTPDGKQTNKIRSDKLAPQLQDKLNHETYASDDRRITCIHGYVENATTLQYDATLAHDLLNS